MPHTAVHVRVATPAGARVVAVSAGAECAVAVAALAAAGHPDPATALATGIWTLRAAGTALVLSPCSLPGGKGGFGSLLRASGRVAKTTNFDACRDLSGRR